MNTPCRYKEALARLADTVGTHPAWNDALRDARTLLKSDGPCEPPDPFEAWWASKDSTISYNAKLAAKAAWDAATSNLKLDHISKQ